MSLTKIEDKDIRDLVSHMIQIDPESRLSAEEYLLEWHGKAFPHYFYSFLYQYVSSLTDHVEQQKDSTIMSALSSAYPNATSKKLTDADEKIERIFHDFEKIMYYVSYPCEDVDDEEKRKIRKGSFLYIILDLFNLCRFFECSHCFLCKYKNIRCIFLANSEHRYYYLLNPIFQTIVMCQVLTREHYINLEVQK